RDRGPYTIHNATISIAEEPLELYNGWLVKQEMTDSEERRIGSSMLEILSSTARTYRLGQAYMDQFECLMANGDVLKPDLCIISKQRYKRQVGPIRPNSKHRMLNGSPELAVELRSPSNLRHEERTKRQKYFENGGLIVWDVDPEKRKIWVYEADKDPDSFVEYGEGDTITCEKLFPGWKRPVVDFFAEDLTSEEIVGEAAKEWRAESKAEGLIEGKAEGRIEGLIEGEAKGRIEGKAEGELEILKKVILLQAGLRFEAEKLPHDLEARLERYTAAQLLALLSTIATSPTLEEWLNSFPV
ncbi:MAG: Uma2 family endonuclease, partial [Chloroflexota bacterium]